LSEAFVAALAMVDPRRGIVVTTDKIITADKKIDPPLANNLHESPLSGSRIKDDFIFLCLTGIIYFY